MPDNPPGVVSPNGIPPRLHAVSNPQRSVYSLTPLEVLCSSFLVLKAREASTTKHIKDSSLTSPQGNRARGELCPMKRMSLAGDVISHVALPSLALALLFGINRLIGAAVALLLGTLLIWHCRKAELSQRT